MPLASTRSSPSSLPVAGRGNSRSSICRGATWTAARTMSAICSVLLNDHAADVLAVFEILAGLVDFLQPVPARDQLVQLQVARAVQAHQHRAAVQRDAGAETSARAFARGSDR